MPFFVCLMQALSLKASLRLFLVTFVTWVIGPAAAAQEKQEPGSHYPYLPEPMVFDLVRPLGARKGETEVNSLFQYPLSGRHRRLEWAPELEWAFANGYAFELELPLENDRVAAYKYALQGVIGPTASRRFMQGWQTIGRYNLHERDFAVDLLYLAGYHITPRWSVFSMTGVQYPKANRGGGRPIGIFNPSLFYRCSPGLIIGLEANTEIEKRAVGHVLLMPQAQIQLNSVYNLEFGIGASREGRGKSFHGTFAMRFVQLLR